MPRKQRNDTKQAATEAGKAAEHLADASRQLGQRPDGCRRQIAGAGDTPAIVRHPACARSRRAIGFWPPDTLAARIDRLAKAQDKVREAAGEQQRASGRPLAADAMSLAQKIDQAHRQAEADQAARKLAEGKADTALDAATRQQEAADQIAQVAEQAEARPQAPDKSTRQSDPLAEALHSAAHAASQAAKQTLDGNPAAATQRAEAARALDKAKQLAKSETKDAQRASGNPGPGRTKAGW